jgi:hypothetical protein
MQQAKGSNSLVLSESPDTIGSTGDIAAEAFARFDRGMPPDEVIAELVLPVDTVEYLWRTWSRLRERFASRCTAVARSPTAATCLQQFGASLNGRSDRVHDAGTARANTA